MADSITRIVPTAVPLDRAQAAGRERRQKSDGGNAPRQRATEPSETDGDDARGPSPDGEKSKGKRLDIRA